MGLPFTERIYVGFKSLCWRQTPFPTSQILLALTKGHIWIVLIFSSMDRVNEQGHHWELHNRHCRQEVRVLKVGILCYTQELINIQYFHRKHLLLLMIYLDVQVSRLLWLCKVFTSGQLWVRSCFTRQGEKQQQPCSFHCLSTVCQVLLFMQKDLTKPQLEPQAPLKLILSTNSI